MPELTAALLKAKTVDLQRLVHAAEPELSDQTGGLVLGLRMAERLLQLWRDTLSPGERGLLMLDSGTDSDRPVPTEAFSLTFETEGSLLKSISSPQHCNQKTLKKRKKAAPECWTGRLGDATPHWRTLYKPLLRKRTGDRQWWILHGAIAFSAFISVRLV